MPEKHKEGDIKPNTSLELNKQVNLPAEEGINFRVVNKHTPDIQKFLENNIPLVQQYMRFYFKMLSTDQDAKQLNTIKLLTGYNDSTDSFDDDKFNAFVTGKNVENKELVLSADKSPTLGHPTITSLPELLKRGHSFLLVEKNNEIVGTIQGVLHSKPGLPKYLTKFHVLNFYAPGYEESTVSKFNQWRESEQIIYVTFNNSILRKPDILENVAALKALTQIPLGSNRTMLHIAAEIRNTDAFKKLLEFIPIETKDVYGATPFSSAAMNCKEKDVTFLKELLALGANFNNHSETYFGNTPIHSSIAAENTLSTILLIKLAKEHGFSLDELDNQQNTPLHLAAIVGLPDVVKSLIENGAKLNEIDYRGFTPLHYAALRGNLDVFNSLLDAGAKIDVKDKANNLPLDLALPKHIATFLDMMQSIHIEPWRANDSMGSYDDNVRYAAGKETVWDAAIKGRAAIVNKLQNLDIASETITKVASVENKLPVNKEPDKNIRQGTTRNI